LAKNRDYTNNGNFDIDLDSNWVGLTNDSGVPQQSSCTGDGNTCSYSSLTDMGSEYGGLAHFNTSDGAVRLTYLHPGTAIWNWFFPGKQKFCSDIHNNMEFDGALAGVLAGVAYKTENPLAAGGSAVLGISAGVEYGIDKTACR
jgi:hypothetical protein